MAIPLRRCHATLISLPTPESVSANVDLPPSPTQAASSTAPIIPPILPAPAPSAPGASSSTRKKQRKQSKPAKKVASPPPPAELSFSLPMLYACSIACGPRLCEWYAKDRPPIGHQNPIPNFIVSTIIRHAMLHRFDSSEEIKKREIATGVADRPKDRELGERDVDDVECGLSGDIKPPAWASVKARPRKSCFCKREAARFSPYPNPSKRKPLIRRSTEDIKASQDEALANRIQLSYEGPIAIAIPNEISAIHIPDEEPFKWEPQYAGPPSEALRDVHNSRSKITVDTVPSSASGLASSMLEDLEDEAAVVELLIRSGSKVVLPLLRSGWA
ncbi:hypothetical protein FRC05_001389 [Tulasnella sp. 425]|nr:hypothetical protein FRC05_001389 [Tulasnella sp. 425]